MRILMGHDLGRIRHFGRNDYSTWICLQNPLPSTLVCSHLLIELYHAISPGRALVCLSTKPRAIGPANGKVFAMCRIESCYLLIRTILYQIDQNLKN